MMSGTFSQDALTSSPNVLAEDVGETITIDGASLTVDQVIRVARHQAKVVLTDREEVVEGVIKSQAYVAEAVENSRPIYGVTTGFGGAADVVISRDNAAEFQNNAIWLHKAGAGKRLPIADVRAAMLLRMNSHLRGASGLRLELIERMQLFLNACVTPYVTEFGSIGASGDLIPLTYITGALIGLDERFLVDFMGQETGSQTALRRLGLAPLRLRPKEGLAMINGTSVMTGIAANCVYDAGILFSLAMGAHALYIQALEGTNQSFHPFIHQLKPHAGQVWAASQMLDLLSGSALIRDELDGRHEYREQDLIQDRYSLRCLPQYLGPIVEGLLDIERQVEVEMNSVSDNPLIDVENWRSYHCGNFLGQYIGVGMDRLRYYIGLVAKHVDVQIALLCSPEFSRGLPFSLVGNPQRQVNMGLKGLQLAGNSIMPLLTFFGNSLADRFPTHAEQYNQNINSQGFGSANLTRQSIDIFQQYMAIGLLFGVQAVDLRTYLHAEHYDARETLSPATAKLYEAVRNVIGKPPSWERPCIWNDNEQFLDVYIARIATDIAAGGEIPQAVQEITLSLKANRNLY